MEKQSGLEIVGVDHFKFAAAGVERFAVRREAKTIKGLIHHDPAGDLGFGFGGIDDGNFMRSPSGMKDSEPTAVGMHGHVHGKIPKGYLLSGRAQRPLVGQLNGAGG